MRALGFRGVRVMVNAEVIRRGIQGEPDPRLWGRSKMGAALAEPCTPREKPVRLE